MKKVSVIIPCYNSKKYLKECFQSVIYQTIGMDALEVIFVNDASTDDTLDLLLEFEKAYPESVMVINLSENGRQGTARNVGLQYASGEYIAFLDSDDFVDSSLYDQAYRLAKEQDVDIVQFSGYDFVVDANGEYSIFRCNYNNRLDNLLSIENDEQRRSFIAKRIMNCECKTKLYRREFLNLVGSKFAEGVIYEEPAFVYPLFFYAKRVYGFRDGKYYIRNHQASTMHSSVKGSGRLYEHPQVQLLTYEFVRDEVENYKIFQQEVEFYFLFSFYIETLYFSKTGNLYLEVEFFRKMQQVVKELVPDWRGNRYLQQEGNRDLFCILETVDVAFDQNQLDELIENI